MLKLHKVPKPGELRTQTYNVPLDTKPLGGVLDTPALNLLAQDSIGASSVGFASNEELRMFCQGEVDERNQRNARMRPNRNYDGYLEIGRAELSMAMQAERESGLTDETASMYHRARTEFLGAVGLLHLPEDLRDVSLSGDEPGLYFMYAYCAEKESLAPNVAPYADPAISQKFDRREDLRRVAKETYETAAQMMVIMANSASAETTLPMLTLAR